MREIPQRGEVLAWLGGVMRGDGGGGDAPTAAQRMKAAELLAKHYGLLDAGGHAAPEPEALRQIAEAMERAKEDYGSGDL